MYYYHVFDLISLFIILILSVFALIHFGKILVLCEIFVDFAVFSVQHALKQVIIRMNGGYGYVKKQQGNYKRYRSGRNRR